MSTFVSTRDLVGESVLEASIIDGTYRNYTEYKDDLLTSIGRRAFYSCTKLVVADFPSLSGSIAQEVFRDCKVLTALILRNNQIVSLEATNAFQSTPIASGTGYIYVPSALIDSYKSATQWATYADQFRALEDYTVDGTITGDFDESALYPVPTLEQGSIDYQSGQDTDATNRVRTLGYFKIYGSSRIEISGLNPDVYQYLVRGYDASGVLTYVSDGWKAVGEIETVNCTFMRMVFGRKDSADLLPSDISGTTVYISGRSYRLEVE